MAFFTWLFMNYHDRPEVIALEDEEHVQEFLDRNKHVLWPSAKEEADKWSNLRLEHRIANDVTVEMNVTQAGDNVADIGAALTARTLDVGLHGMRVTSTESLSAGCELALTVIKDADTGKRYCLNGELRWVAPLEDGYLMGIKIDETAEFSSWQTDFGREFVTPVLAGKN